MQRRQILKHLTAAAAACVWPTVTASAWAGTSAATQAATPPKILLRSSWQTVNIGDIAHTPGVLAILEREWPDAEVRLWPSRVDNGVREILLSRFPKLTIVQSSKEVSQAFKECDFLLHGSGPSLVAEKDVVRWKTETQKPYGIYGITLPAQSSTSTTPTPEAAMQATIAVLSGASFVFFRDSVSLQLAKSLGCSSPIMEFGPDGAFATDLRDDTRALQFMKTNGLEKGKFLCCIPRLRYTPYWLVPERNMPRDEAKQARNEAMKEHDHAPHRAAIERIVRETDMKILICPEDKTQMAVGKEMLFDKLPADVQKRCVWRSDYWLPGEAISTYIRSAGLFGNEMHSPIMCTGHAIPAIVCRWAEQTSKGIMWKDIGLQDWLFDLDNEADVQRLPDTAFAIAKDPAAAKATASAARDRVKKRQRETIRILQKAMKK